MEVLVTTGAIRRAKLQSVKMSPQTNQHPAFYRPDALPVTQPCQSSGSIKYVKHGETTATLSAFVQVAHFSVLLWVDPHHS